MRVLVVGSSRDNERNVANIQAAGRAIGKLLAERGHTIVVGGDDREDVDPWVIDGAAEAGSFSAEVHVPREFEAPFRGPERPVNQRVQTIWHSFRDWDVTVLEVVRARVDAVIVIGGRKGAIHAGVSAWMMGTPVIPVGSFGGGAETVWQYSSSRRRDFYYGALNDDEIDRLTGPWPAAANDTFVVDALERVRKSASMARISWKLLVSILGLMVAALVAWVGCLSAPFLFLVPGVDQAIPGEQSLPLLFATVAVAGIAGGLMQTLRVIRGGSTIHLSLILVDLVLGLAAGFVSAALYMLAQVAVSGQIEVSLKPHDYVRVALIASMVSLFAALYIDTALARFDAVKARIIRGEFDRSGGEAPSGPLA